MHSDHPSMTRPRLLRDARCETLEDLLEGRLQKMDNRLDLGGFVIRPSPSAKGKVNGQTGDASSESSTF